MGPAGVDGALGAKRRVPFGGLRLSGVGVKDRDVEFSVKSSWCLDLVSIHFRGLCSICRVRVWIRM